MTQQTAWALLVVVLLVGYVVFDIVAAQKRADELNGESM